MSSSKSVGRAISDLQCSSVWHLAVPGSYPSNYEPGATLLNFSGQADTDKTTQYSSDYYFFGSIAYKISNPI